MEKYENKTNEEIEFKKYLEEFEFNQMHSNKRIYDEDNDEVEYFDDVDEDARHQLIHQESKIGQRVCETKLFIDENIDFFNYDTKGHSKADCDTKDSCMFWALSMYCGGCEFNEKIFFKAFELMENNDIVYFLSHEDVNHFCDNIDFVKKMIEHSGAPIEVFSSIPESSIRKYLNSKDTMQMLYDMDDVKSKFNGAEILSILLVQVKKIKELSEDKEFLINLMKNIRAIEKMDDKSNYLISGTIVGILSNIDKKFFADRNNIEAVLSFFEDSKYEFLFLEDSEKEEFFDRVVSNPEMANDKELAYRYMSVFDRNEGVNPKLYEDEEFLLRVLNNIHGASFSNIEIPHSLYKNEEILSKYIHSKDFLTNKLFYDFDNDVLKKLFNEYYGYSMEYSVRSFIEYLIEKKQSIVVCGDDDTNIEEAVNIIQAWAEDKDLVKIGHKINVIKSTDNKIQENHLNIVTGENGKCMGNKEYNEETLVLDGNKILETLKILGLDTRLDIYKMHEQCEAMIEKINQESKERKIIPRDIIYAVNNSDLTNGGKNLVDIKYRRGCDPYIIVSVPHPEYRNEYITEKIDCRELYEIIRIANENSYEEGIEKLNKIADEGINEIVPIDNWASKIRFKTKENIKKIIGTIGEGDDSPYVIKNDIQDSEEDYQYEVIMPREVLDEEFGTDSIILKYGEIKMNKEQLERLNQKQKEVQNIMMKAQEKKYMEKKVDEAKDLLNQYEDLTGNKNKTFDGE